MSIDYCIPQIPSSDFPQDSRNIVEEETERIKESMGKEDANENNASHADHDWHKYELTMAQAQYLLRCKIDEIPALNGLIGDDFPLL